jgi:hypothetical protein
MNNPLPLRLLMIFVMLVSMLAAALAIIKLKFPENAVVVFLAVAATAAVIFFAHKKEEAARFDVYYTTVREFGTPVHFGKHESAFERDGTRFDIKYPHGKYENFFKVNFHLPKLGEKFSIQNRTLATRYDDDCRTIENSTLPPEYLVQSRNPEFLLNFLKNRAVRDEILNYTASIWGRILISLDGGYFQITWVPPVSEQIEGFYRICQSAVVFHDELKKLSEKY